MRPKYPRYEIWYDILSWWHHLDAESVTGRVAECLYPPIYPRNSNESRAQVSNMTAVCFYHQFGFNQLFNIRKKTGKTDRLTADPSSVVSFGFIRPLHKYCSKVDIWSYILISIETISISFYIFSKYIMLYCISTSFYLVFSFLSTAASKRCAVVLVWDAGALVQYQVPVSVITFHFWMLVIRSSILFYYLFHVGRYEKQWSGPLRSDLYTCTNSTQFPDDLYRYNLFFLLQHKQNQLNTMMIIINVKTMYCTLSSVQS